MTSPTPPEWIANDYGYSRVSAAPIGDRQGTMGTLWLFKNKMDIIVVCKVIRRDWSDKISLEKLLHEAKVMAQVKHPNVVQVYTLLESRNALSKDYAIEMEYIEDGKNLVEFIEEKNECQTTSPLDCDLIVEIMKGVLSGVAEAHSKKIVHCDLNPKNIIIDTKKTGKLGKLVQSCIKVCDFGIATPYTLNFDSTDQTIESEKIIIDKWIGTWNYASPEKFRGYPPQPQSDVYALGVLLYWLLAGAPPFPPCSSKGQEDKFRHFKEHHCNVLVPDITNRENIPQSLVDIYKKAMSKKPGDRFKDAGEMLDALEKKSRKTSEDRFKAERAMSNTSGAANTDNKKKWHQMRSLVIPVFSILVSLLVAVWNRKKLEEFLRGNGPNVIGDAEPVRITSITIKPETTLFIGKTEKLIATVFPDNAKNTGLIWLTNNSGVATVDTNGLVTAHAVGKAEITVTAALDKNIEARCTVEVKPSSGVPPPSPPPVTSITINKPEPKGSPLTPPRGSVSILELLPGLDVLIKQKLLRYEENSYWNQQKENCNINVDFSWVNTTYDKNFGTIVYEITGFIVIELVRKNGVKSSADIQLERIIESETDRRLIQKKILNCVIIPDAINALGGFH